MEGLLANAQQLIVVFGIKIVAAIAVFILGRWISGIVRNLITRLMRKREVDETLVKFNRNLIYIALVTFVVIAALAQLGIQTTSFIAIVGAAGLAIYIALQGSLANFSAGVLMIIFRPFKVDDYIEGCGTADVVEKISIFTTRLKTPDNKTITVPNAKMTSDNITNYSTKEERRVDLVVGVR